MTKCSTLVPAIRQSGFIISVIFKTYTLKDLSALSKCVLPHPDSLTPQGDSNYSCTPSNGPQIRGEDFRSRRQKCKYLGHRKQRSWKVPALTSAGPGPEVSPNPALSRTPRRAGHGKVSRELTQRTRGGRRSRIRQKATLPAFYALGFFSNLGQEVNRCQAIDAADGSLSSQHVNGVWQRYRD